MLSAYNVPGSMPRAFFFRVTHSMHEHVLSHSRVRLFVTPWTAARQAPLSVEFSRQEY